MLKFAEMLKQFNTQPQIIPGITRILQLLEIHYEVSLANMNCTSYKLPSYERGELHYLNKLQLC